MDQELAQLRERFPAEQLKSCSAAYVLLEIRKSRFCSASLKVSLPTDGYPNEIARLLVSSTTLPEELTAKYLARLEKEVDAHKGKPHLLPVVELFAQIMAANRLATAFDEVRQVKALVPACKISEAKGTLTLPLEQGPYKLSVKVTVPEEYPAELPTVQLTGGNFPKEWALAFVSQAMDKAHMAKGGVRERVTVRDVKTGEAVATDHRSSQREQFKQEVAAGKAAEKARKEAEKKKKVVEERKPWHAPIGKKEQRSALQSNGDRALPPEDDYELRKKKREAKQQQAVEEPTQKYDKMACFPSLLPLVHYLAIECVMRLPQESCKICGKRLLPEDPGKLQDGALGALQPERMYCGHWYHHKCLGDFLANPPFPKGGKLCLVCERPMHHPKFNCDVKFLEKQWAMKQARKREIDEVKEFLDIML